MKDTSYSLPVSTLGNRRLIEPVEEEQGGCNCDSYWVTDRKGVFLNSGTLIYIGIKNLINLHARNLCQPPPLSRVIWRMLRCNGKALMLIILLKGFKNG